MIDCGALFDTVTDSSELLSRMKLFPVCWAAQTKPMKVETLSHHYRFSSRTLFIIGLLKSIREPGGSVLVICGGSLVNCYSYDDEKSTRGAMVGSTRRWLGHKSLTA